MTETSIKQKAKVWQVTKAGKFERLKQTELPIAPALPNEIQVQVKSVGLNFADIFAITGLYSATPSGAFVPGLEFSGIVSSVGANINRFRVGDKVMGCCRFGAYASQVNVPAIQCEALPDGWSFEEGAAYLVQTFTAWYALFELGALQAGQNVLVHSAAGGVGLQALQMIKASGANAIACVGNQDKATWLQSLGNTEVLVRDGNFPAKLKQLMNHRPLHLVLDAIGGRIQKASFDALAPTGRLVTYGAAQYTPGANAPRWLRSAWLYLTRPKYDALAMVSDNKSIMGFNLIWLWQNTQLFQRMFTALNKMNLDAPFVERHFGFEQMPQALEYLRSGMSRGKIVVNL